MRRPCGGAHLGTGQPGNLRARERQWQGQGDEAGGRAPGTTPGPAGELRGPGDTWHLRTSYPSPFKHAQTQGCLRGILSTTDTQWKAFELLCRLAS